MKNKKIKIIALVWLAISVMLCLTFGLHVIVTSEDSGLIFASAEMICSTLTIFPAIYLCMTIGEKSDSDSVHKPKAPAQPQPVMKDRLKKISHRNDDGEIPGIDPPAFTIIPVETYLPSAKESQKRCENKPKTKVSLSDTIERGKRL